MTERVIVQIDGHQHYAEFEGEVVSYGQSVEFFGRVPMQVPSLTLKNGDGIRVVSLVRELYQVRVKPA